MQIQELLSKYERVIVLDDTLVKQLSPLLTERIKVVSIEEEQAADILDLYRKYEFSVQVLCLLPDSNYGTLYNYVKTGIMTEEEMLDALLN